MTPRDYLILSEKTLSNEIHNRNANSSKLFSDLRFFCLDADRLDNYKKALFYNKIVDQSIASEVEKFPICIEESEAHYLHGVLGIATEAGEIVQAFMNWRWRLTPNQNYDIKFIRPNVIEELGDLLWYVALLCRYFNTTFEELFEKNISKLRLRYGDKFTELAAEMRDLVAEQKIFE